MSLTFAAAKTYFADFGNDVGNMLNFVCRRAIELGQWKGSIIYADFPIFDYTDNGVTKRQITLGRRFDSASGIKFTLDTGHSVPRIVHGQWWRWRTGQQDPINNTGLSDLGAFPIFRSLPSAGRLKAYTSTTESANKTLLIRGYSNGSIVYTGTGGSMIEGELLTLPQATGSVTSSTTFDAGDSIYWIVKSSTNGPVTLYHVAADNTETLIGTYEPGELVPEWRRYEVPRGSTYESGLVMAKMKPIDAVADNDPVIPDSVTALFYGLRAYNYEKNHESDRADEYFAKMMDSLNGQLRQTQGNQLPRINVASGNSYNFRQIQ